MSLLEINTDLLDIYFQRSWATFTESDQKINFHTHSQSNISFAYYLLKPKNSGGIIFRSNELQNELAKNLFTSSKMEKSLINKANVYNSDKSMFDQYYSDTNFTLDFVIRYHFYTSINLNSDQNELISMDGTKFNLSSKNAKDLTDEFISLVSKMYVGRKEFIEFKKLNKNR